MTEIFSSRPSTIGILTDACVIPTETARQHRTEDDSLPNSCLSPSYRSDTEVSLPDEYCSVAVFGVIHHADLCS